MFSKRTEPRSIASQLVLLFTPAAVLLLSCALAVLYWIVVRHAFQEDNAFLADKIVALRTDLKKPEPLAALNAELKMLRGGEHPTYWIRIVDSNGAILAETSEMGTLLPAAIFPSPQSSGPAIANAKDYRTDGKLFSLVATREDILGQTCSIQIAQDRSEDEKFGKEFAALLAVVLAFGTIASAVIAVTVTKRGLRPLSEITRSLKRVGPTHLHERVAPTGWPRELQPLGVAFDEMLNRLEDSFTRLSQFSADLAHELRTPVANLLGEAQVTLTRTRTTDEYREVIESSVTECERLSGIIDKLLFLARSEAADGTIQKTKFDGKEAIEKIAGIYESLAEEQQVSISCSGQAQVCADPELFGRAVSNLVENALRFTAAGGTIRIAVNAQGKGAQVSVSDTGSGIAAEHLPRVFDRFYRVDSSRSSAGAGLGLALVKSIVDLHGGSAAAESEVGHGTTVTLIFPN